MCCRLEKDDAMRLAPMTLGTADAAIEEFLRQARRGRRHSEAAVVCCGGGNLDQGVTIALGVEPLMHDVNAFLGATTPIKRSRQF